MGRVKTRMELITSNKKRESTFQVRSKGMKKKAYELSTLCGVKLGIIIINSSGKLNAETWPKDEEKEDSLDDLITSYRNQELVQRKKRSFNISHFLEAQKVVDNQVVQKTRYSIWDSSIDDMSEQELQDLNISVEMKMKSVKRKIQYLKDNKGKNVITPQQPPIPVPQSHDDLDKVMDQMLGLPTSPQQFSSTEGFGFEFNPYKNDDDIIRWINNDDAVAYNFAKPAVIDCYLQQSTHMMSMPMMMIDPSKGDFGTPWAHDISSFVQYPTNMMPPMMTIEAPTDSSTWESEFWYPMLHDLRKY